MKKILLPLLLLTGILANAQTCGLMLFTENGEKFKLSTNGTLRNPQPLNEIKLCGFPSDIVKIRLEFEDKTVLEKTMYLRMGVIEHHRVSKKSDGTWRVAFDSDENIPTPYQNTTVVTVINVQGIGFDPQPVATTTIVTQSNNCGLPISDRSFYEFYGHLKNMTFDSDQLKEAKDAVRRGCFSSNQIKMTLTAFTYESSRLEFAKYAYDFAYDKGAYSLVKEGFSNSLSGDELDQYLRTK